MERHTLPAISNWQRKNGITYHLFPYNDIIERIKIEQVLSTFMSNHRNYQLCKGEKMFKLIKNG